MLSARPYFDTFLGPASLLQKLDKIVHKHTLSEGFIKVNSLIALLVLGFLDRPGPYKI